ncbi:hypothetical protein ACS3SW_01090 [Roseobacteraceae bacterium S113]
MIRALAYPMAFCAATQASALALPDCTRTTHISHAGEAVHEDLGEARVMWQAWWSQEGTAVDYVIADCDSGAALRFRVAEDNMSDRLPFNRTDAALKIVRDIEAGDRVFASLDRMGAAVAEEARDVALLTLAQEPCACAALYPELRGAKAAFEFEDLPEGFGQAKN